MDSSPALPQLEAVAETIRRIETIPSVAGLTVEAYGVRLGVRVDDASILPEIRNYLPFGAQIVADRPALVQRLFSMRTHREHGWPALFVDGECVFTLPDLNHVFHVLEIEAKAFVAEAAPRHVFVHAATLAWDDRALLIPGGSYTGKTTLAAELVRAGATFYSDEYAVIGEDGLVHPYARPLGLRKPGGTLHEWRPVEELGGEVGTKPIPMGFVVSAPYRARARWKPEPISAAHGVAVLMANSRAALRRPESVLDILERAARDAVMLQGERGEAAETAVSIMAMLQRS